jgi:glycerophosphoryl diester phosphodiesterase
MLGLWLLPAIFPPNWAYQGDLPAKPALIAHRGASMLAPENTIAAAELAAEYDAFGFETDVRISLDSVPFLMHDDTLRRTTNILEVYPDRTDEDASNFTMDELYALNAGLWFIQKDPFNTIESGLISQAQLSVNQGQKIPTLSQALGLVDDEKMVILFDLRYPPQDHPFYDQFFDIVFDLCKESGLNGDVWLLVDRRNIDKVLAEAPQMTRVSGVSSTDLPDPDELIALNYEIVNVDAGILKDAILGYRQKGLGVNVYTIDQPWLFSQFWLSGVTSITTNNIHTLSQLDEPILNLPYSRFLLFWGLYGIIVAIWIASSQPKIKTVPQELGENEPPDLLDFAMEEESKTDGINETDAGSENNTRLRDRVEKNDWLEVDLNDELEKDNNQ